MTEESRNTGNKKRDHIGNVLYGLYLILVLLSVVIIVKLVYIQLFYNPDPRMREALSPKVITREVEPVRGNIYDCQDRLLAITCPVYQIAMDCTVRKEEFAKNQDKAKGDSLESAWRAKARKLAAGLAKHFPQKSADRYYQEILKNRQNGRKYYKIGTPVERREYLEIKQLPLFREGPNKGGLIIETINRRRYPYGDLAARTIGFRRAAKSEVGNKNVGLEGKFDFYLHGVAGKEFLRATDYGCIHDNDSSDIRPKDGLDLHTTLNIDYQHIASNALHNQIDDEDDLEGACLVLMEVKTGAIRAMVNLSRDLKSTGNYSERINLAVGRAIEPGSVFKTVTLTSVLADGYIKSLDEKMPTNHGIISGTRNKQDQHIVDFERSKRTNRISMSKEYSDTKTLSALYITTTSVVALLIISFTAEFFPFLFFWNIGSMISCSFERSLMMMSVSSVLPLDTIITLSMEKHDAFWSNIEFMALRMLYCSLYAHIPMVMGIFSESSYLSSGMSLEYCISHEHPIG